MAASPEITKGLTVFDKRAEHGKLPCQAQVIHIVTGCYILQQLLARQAVAHAFATGLTAAVDKSGRGDVVRAGSIAPGDGGRSVRDTQSATAPPCAVPFSWFHDWNHGCSVQETLGPTGLARERRRYPSQPNWHRGWINASGRQAYRRRAGCRHRPYRCG